MHVAKLTHTKTNNVHM